jgi:hypothetical protein
MHSKFIESVSVTDMDRRPKSLTLFSMVLPLYVVGDRGGTVVKVLCYKSEGCWFDSRWCHWNFSLT